jgi:hypothetical protein
LVGEIRDFTGDVVFEEHAQTGQGWQKLLEVP